MSVAVPLSAVCVIVVFPDHAYNFLKLCGVKSTGRVTLFFLFNL